MMKKIITSFLLSFALSICSFSQQFPTSNFLSSSGNMRIKESLRLDDGVLLFGDFLGTIERPQVIIPDSRDIILAKYNDNYSVSWIKHIGGASIDLAQDITVDNNGNIYILASFKETCSFDGMNEITSDGDYDAFIAKYNSSGSFIWAKKIAYNLSTQYGSSIDFDGSDLVIVGSYKDSISFENDKFVSSYGMYLAKFDVMGNFLLAKNIESSSSTSSLESVSAFSDGYYLNGRFLGNTTFDLGVYSSNDPIYADVFLYKTDYNGNGQWIRRSYGDDNAFTGTIAQDNYGNIYFTGLFNGTTLEVDSTSILKSNKIIYNKGGADIFVLKYNKNGNLIWNNGYGVDGSDWARDIKFGKNAFYITGYFSDTIIFDKDTLYSSSLTDQDAFIGAIDQDGNPIIAIKLEDSDDNNESGMTISIGENDTVYWGGTFKSALINIGDSIFNNPNLGKQCIFITKGKAPLTAVFTKKERISCNGQTDGELTVTPYFGVAPYTYFWSHNPGLTDSIASGLAPATYTVTVTDAVDSTAVVNYNLTEPDIITFNPIVTDVTACSYSEEGIIDLNMAGGNGGFEYQWQAIDGGCGIVLSAEDQSGLTVGTFTVSATDVEGCIGDTTIIISGPDPILFGSSVVTDSSGIGAGAIDLIYSGGFGDPASFGFNWTGPYGFTQITEDISNLRPGNYDITVTDVHLCEFDTTFNVLNLDTFYIYMSKHKDACNGTINGTATVSYYSPDSHTAINYLWDANAGNQTTAQATNLAPGRYYYVTVTDTENTPNTVLVDSVYIDELSYAFAGSLSGTTTLQCFGDSDGYIDLSITTQGTTPYTYNWSSGSSLQDLTGLSTGTYSVTVTDKYSCQFSIINYTIDEPTAVSAVAEIVTTPSCNGDYDGEVTVDRSGGTAPYTYLWDDPGFQDTRNADGLDAGYYTVTVYDVNNCEATSGVNLTEPDAINISKNITDEVCNGAGEGAVSLTTTGGTIPFTYLWTTSDGSGLVPSDKNQSGLTAGKYYFTATDDNNCTLDDSVEITEPPLLQITNEEKTDITTCYGENIGTITITATGGTGMLTYTLNPGAIQTNNTGSFTGLAAGTYSVYVEDENGCNVTSSSIEITQPGQLIRTDNSVNNATCNATDNGSIEISVTGGTIATDYTYTWTTSDGSGLIAGVQDQPTLGAGTYYLTVSDDNSCQLTSNYTLTEPTAIVVSKSKSDLACNGDNDGGINLTVSGGIAPYTYTWSTTDGTGLVITDKNQSGLTAGKYYFTVTDDNSCNYIDSVEITEPPLLQITNEEKTDITTCYGENIGTITITATGGTGLLTYTLNPGAIQTNNTGSFTGLAAGTYSVYIEDENGCNVTSSSIEITQPSQLIRIDNSVNNATCNGIDNGSIEISVTGGTIAADYTYAWTTSDGSGLIAGVQDQPTLGAGTYYLTVSDDNSCQLTSSYTLTEPTAVVVSKVKSDLICNGDNDGGVNLTVSGGVSPYSYLWSTTDGSGLVTTDKNQSGLTAGKYYFTVTDDNTCDYIDSVEITEPILLEITNELISDVVTCNGENTGTIDITASGGTGVLTYTLNPVNLSNTSGSFTDLIAGSYSVSVEDDNACLATTGTLIVSEPAELVLTVDEINNATCNGINNGNIAITITGGSIASDYTYTWTTTDGSGLIAGVQDQPTLGAGTYYLTVSDDNSCELTSNYTLTEPDTILVTKTVYNPNCYNTVDGVIVVSHTGGVLPFAYYWTTNDGTGLQPVNRNQGGLAGGTYVLEITDALGCIVYNTTTLIAPPEITIDTENSTDATALDQADGSVTVEATGGTGVLSYVLKPGNVQNQTGIFPAVLPGDYTVEINDENFCGPIISSTITVGYPDAIEDIIANNMVRIYPNPTSGKLNIELDYDTDKLNLEILSVTGRLIFNKTIKQDEFLKQEIDLSNYAKGIYLIRIYNDEISYTDKILFQ